MPRFSWARSTSLRIAAALLAIVLVGTACTSFDEQQRRWIFQPSKDVWGSGTAGMADVQEVWITFESKVTHGPEKLNALWLPSPNPAAPVLLYLHGARWSVAGSAGRMDRMRELGFSVLGIDYRGFGKSSEELPSEQTAYEDARIAWQWLAQQHPEAHRFIFGHSLGAAVAVNLATEVSDASGLIVEGSFTSIADVFSSFRWGWLPVSALITQRFDSGAKISHIRAPLLVVHGSEDTLIRPSLGRALYDKAPAPKRFVLVEGGSHHSTNWVGRDDYRAALQDLYGL